MVVRLVATFFRLQEFLQPSSLTLSVNHHFLVYQYFQTVYLKYEETYL